MSDSRVVQCFGVKRRPGKAERICRKKYLWIARGASAGNFGRKGAQACPSCGTIPDFRHPINRFLNGTLSQEKAQEILQQDYNADWTRKEE